MPKSCYFCDEITILPISPQNEKMRKHEKFELINISSLRYDRVAKQMPRGWLDAAPNNNNSNLQAPVDPSLTFVHFCDSVESVRGDVWKRSAVAKTVEILDSTIDIAYSCCCCRTFHFCDTLSLYQEWGWPRSPSVTLLHISARDRAAGAR